MPFNPLLLGAASAGGAVVGGLGRWAVILATPRPIPLQEAEPSSRS